MSLFRLEPRVQHYSWGDTRFLPAFLGRDNAEGIPFAELWMGAHPELPSFAGRTNLRELISRNPETVLGAEVASVFGGELPYLFKVLTAAKPLSIQVHPNQEQAMRGFIQENEARISPSAPGRCYRDPRGKPELVAALGDFYALVGFRPLEEIATVLEEVPELRRVSFGFRPTRDALRPFYEKLMSLPQSQVDLVLDPILTRLRRRSFDRDRREFWMVRCDDEVHAREGRHDPGLFSILLMNLLHLRAKEAVFLEPGVLHGYLEGNAVEIMASSNNVLRGGLTEKHVNLPELIRTVAFSANRPEVLLPLPGRDREQKYETRANEFELRILDPSFDEPYASEAVHGAEILLVVEAEGELVLESGGERLRLRRGQSALVTHGTRYRLIGQGTIYAAGVPDRTPRFRGRKPKELRFGTSGLRGPVDEMTDLEVYVDTRGFLDYLLERREIYRGDFVLLAGDLRPSTDRILATASRAVQDTGLRAEYQGKIPTPALTYAATSLRRASIMVTGSHIPFDRNGIKFNRPTGEILKWDEPGILESVARVRRLEYGKPRAESPFGDDGMRLADRARGLPEAVTTAREAYLRRCLDFFPDESLVGKRLVFYQHSAVGRDLLIEILRALGAEVLPMGRAEAFVPVDTEDIGDDRMSELKRLVAVARDTLGAIDALVSTDGDSDRPLVVGVDPDGTVHFFGGDLLGIVAAEYLRADAVVVPVSVNDAVDLWCAQRGIRIQKTRIGSPYVIEGMEELNSGGGYRRVVGFEANGGFLTGSDIEMSGRRLRALATRDAALPMLAALHAAAAAKCTLSSLFSRLPLRFGKSGLLDGFSPRASRAILRRFASVEGRPALSSFFGPEAGFDSILRVDDTDGLRILFANGDIAHIRPSGNAPQLRIYAFANRQERAKEIVKLALAEPDGILRRMERAASD